MPLFSHFFDSLQFQALDIINPALFHDVKLDVKS
jgi:hypothetical protein